ncbi:MAG: SAM-dependent methyltransferase, partial [Myxococcota bacterium]
PGKTNELVTQMAINLALATADLTDVETPRLLDPMAGRGTTLLWAHRYGLDAFGVEPQPKDREAFERHVKKQTKLHRLKHRRQSGTIDRTNRQQVGHFIEFEMGDRIMRLVTGDSRELAHLVQRRRFHCIVADLPYGIQHTTPQGTRNPAALLAEVVPLWAKQMVPGGAMVLSFNTYQPKRKALINIVEDAGLTVMEFSAHHRMSESIVRDFIVARRERVSNEPIKRS